jgi:hypothetical protein
VDAGLGGAGADVVEAAVAGGEVRFADGKLQPAARGDAGKVAEGVADGVVRGDLDAGLGCGGCGRR